MLLHCVPSGLETLWREQPNKFISHNVANSGGAIEAQRYTVLLLNDSFIQFNIATQNGGGMFLRSIGALLAGVTVESNTVLGGNGGGVFVTLPFEPNEIERFPIFTRPLITYANSRARGTPCALTAPQEQHSADRRRRRYLPQHRQ